MRKPGISVIKEWRVQNDSSEDPRLAGMMSHVRISRAENNYAGRAVSEGAGEAHSRAGWEHQGWGTYCADERIDLKSSLTLLSRTL